VDVPEPVAPVEVVNAQDDDPGVARPTPAPPHVSTLVGVIETCADAKLTIPAEAKTLAAVRETALIERAILSLLGSVSGAESNLTQAV
jgi:hypothetical protein